MTFNFSLHNFLCYLLFAQRQVSHRRRDRSVGIAIRYGLHGPGSISGGANIFSSPQCPDRLWRQPGLLSNRYRGTFPGSKAAGREADQLPPSSAEVKKGGSKVRVLTSVTAQFIEAKYYNKLRKMFHKEPAMLKNRVGHGNGRL
jgi:hypothetical protein